MDNAFTLVFCIVLPLALVIAFIVAGDRRRKGVEQAHAAYQGALRALKANPTNPDLRQRALALGREYSNLTRSQRGVTVYDEMAVMNDINAATAAAVSVVAPAPVAAPPVPVEERLKRLDELRTKGVISEQEFAERRQKILSEL